MALFRGQEITIGADPEAFGIDANGSIVSMIGKIGGNKRNPFPVNRGALQEDNILAEFNIDPANNVQDFITNITTVIGEMHKHIYPYRLQFKSYAMFEPGFFKLAGPKSMEFGCEPDYDAWTLNINERPNSSSLMRTAAGHVHVGFEMEDDLDPYRAAILMDFYVGLPSVILDPDGAHRRGMYGRAGACRPKEYGVEYRVPSNFWLQSEGMMEWIFNSSILAIQNIDRFEELHQKYEGIVTTIINSSDQKGAERVMKEVGVVL